MDASHALSPPMVPDTEAGKPETAFRISCGIEGLESKQGPEFPEAQFN